MKKSTSKRNQVLTKLGIGFTGKIIPEFLSEIGVSTEDPKLILYLAASFGRKDIVEYFAENSDPDLDFSIEKIHVLLLALENRHNEIVDYCLKFTRDQSLINLGIDIKGKIIPEFLNEIGVSTDDPKLILYLAASFGRKDIVEFFAGALYPNLDFSIEKNHVLLLASENRHHNIVKFCLYWKSVDGS